MSASRIALVAAGGALLAAWLAAATTPPAGNVAVAVPPADVPAPYAGTQPAAAAADLAADLERLRQRRNEAPALRTSARNPFSLAPPAPPAPPPALDPPSRSAAPIAARRAQASGPAVELIGIATEDAGDGPEYTGILTTSGGDVLLVRGGDPVPGGYRVGAVDASSVTLVDETGARRRLALP